MDRPDHFGEFRRRAEYGRSENLGDCELSDGENQIGTKEFHLQREVPTATRDFLRVGKPVPTAARGFARETAGNGRHIDAFAEMGFRDAGGFFEPPKKRFTRGVREGATPRFLVHARRLAKEENPALNRRSMDGAAHHLRTVSALGDRPLNGMEFRKGHRLGFYVRAGREARGAPR